MTPSDATPEAEPGARLRRTDVATAAACVGLGLLYGAALAWHKGAEAGRQYASAYLLELSLSVDNVFVFALVFNRLSLGPGARRRALLWGLAGAAILRTLLIVLGLGAIRRLAWLIPVLGALILATGVRLAVSGKARPAPDPTRGALGWAQRHLPPWLAVLVVVETADLVFALDSIPAVIAVTHDVGIAVASNLFSILGLRSLFFVVSAAMGSLRHLNTGLAAVLAFVGLKMLAEPWYAVPSSVSLAAIAVMIAVSVAASLVPKRPGRG
jgi:tellurite resistance protein TerC